VGAQAVLVDDTVHIFQNFRERNPDLDQVLRQAENFTELPV